MSKRIDRRTLVRSALTAGAGVLLAPSAGWSAAQKARLATEGAFAQGVASGEPATNAITLWTRLDGATASANVGYEVAHDAGFAKVVASGTAAADATADFTVHQRVSGAFLKPGEQYYYRFKTAADSSPVGRVRTARPAGSSETVRIAFFSCQEFIAGFYAAHRDLAAQDVDLVVCLGDYIYEQAFASTDSTNAPVRTDDSAADGEAQTLAEYRRKYSLYHSDANLREVRRQFALVGEWDDHEIEDNYAGDLPGGAAKNRRVPFAERRANGYRAWFEHMPRRLAGQPKIYGSLPLGGAELFVLDSRQYRGDQPCNPTDAALSEPCPPTTTDDPSRTGLHPAQLPGGLRAARGHRPGWSAAGVSAAAHRSSASTSATDSPAAGSVVTSSVRAGRCAAQSRHDSSWASSIHASGRSPAWASIAASFQCRVSPSCAGKVRNGSASGKTRAPRRWSLAFSSHPLHQTRSKGAARRCRWSEALAEIRWTMPSTFSHMPCGRLSD
jgi:alkaline phosphatase D